MGLKDIGKEPEKVRRLDMRTISIVISAILVFITAIVLYNGLTIRSTPFSEEDVLEISNDVDIVKDFITRKPSYNTKIEVIGTKNLTSLSEKYPAIYGNLTNGVFYRVEYTSTDEGILLILDSNREIIKYYRTKNLNL